MSTLTYADIANGDDGRLWFDSREVMFCEPNRGDDRPPYGSVLTFKNGRVVKCFANSDVLSQRIREAMESAPIPTESERAVDRVDAERWRAVRDAMVVFDNEGYLSRTLEFDSLSGSHQSSICDRHGNVVANGRTSDSSLEVMESLADMLRQKGEWT